MNALQFGIAHRVASQRLLVGAYALNIDTHWSAVEHADDGLATMAQIEMHIGASDDVGLAVHSIFKRGRLHDAIFLAQALAQQ